MVLVVLGGAWRCSVCGLCSLVLLSAVWWRLVALGGAWRCCVIGPCCAEVGAWHCLGVLGGAWWYLVQLGAA